MIDPAHGGTESGAVLNPVILEKDVTLAIARQLHQELSNRGLQAQLLREGDATVSTDQRAAMVNAARPTLYLSIHASSQGTGLRIYTAMLPFGGDDLGPFVHWQRAQSAVLARSRSVQQQIAIAIQRLKFPVRSLPAPLKPLNNITVPALAVEVAPTAGDISQLAASDYQRMISVVLANSLASQRSGLESAP